MYRAIRTWKPLDWEQNDDGEPVEAVVDGCPGEGPPELVPISHLSQGHDRVGDGGADVGTHDNEESGRHRQNCRFCINIIY